MDWDVVFLVSGLPKENRFRDKHYFMADVTNAHQKKLAELTKQSQASVAFFSNPNLGKLTAIGFRLDADSEGDAINFGAERLDGFIDCLSILCEHNLPSICPLVKVNKSGDNDSVFVEVYPTTWAYFEPKDPNSKANWKERSDRVFQALFPFFDIASGIHANPNTSLVRQLVYSMKMYRHGASTRIYGLEFICKWSALEGLICGSQRQNKRQLLLSRLPKLFPQSQDTIDNLVKKLWALRNSAVHEAKAFDFIDPDRSAHLGMQIEEVERLYLAVFLFALAHVDKANSVEDLWAFASAFSLPAFATQKRPKDMVRFVVTSMRGSTSILFQGGGAMFNRALLHGMTAS